MASPGERSPARYFWPVFRAERRRLLTVGIGGAILLGSTALLPARRSRGQTAAHAGDAFLRPPDRRIMAAIAPVLLDGALPTEPEERETALAEVLAGIDRAFEVLPPATRTEARQLFDLLDFAPARILLARLWSRWEDSAPEEIDRALRSWRDSWFDLLRVAYLALHEMTLVSWYANPLSWPTIGYEDPRGDD